MAAPPQLAVQFHKSRYADDDHIGYAVFRGVRSLSGANGIDNNVFAPVAGGRSVAPAPPEGNPLGPNEALPKGSYYILAVYENLAPDGRNVGRFGYTTDPRNANSVAAQLADGEIIRFYAVAAFTNLQGATDSIQRANSAAPPTNLAQALQILSNAAGAAAAAAPGALTPIVGENNFHLWRLMVGNHPNPNLELHLQSDARARLSHVYTITSLELETYNGGRLNAFIPGRLDFNASTVDNIHIAYIDQGNVLTITLRRAPNVNETPEQIRGGGNLIGGGNLSGTDLIGGGTDLIGSNLSGTDLTGGYSAPQYSIGGGRYKTSRTYKKKRSNKNKKNKNDTRK